MATNTIKLGLYGPGGDGKQLGLYGTDDALSSILQLIYNGSTQITSIYAGSTAITEVYVGSTLIWQSS